MRPGQDGGVAAHPASGTGGSGKLKPAAGSSANDAHRGVLGQRARSGHAVAQPKDQDPQLPQARYVQDQARALLAITMHIRRIGTNQARPSLRQPHLQMKHPVNMPERIGPQPAPAQRMRGRRDQHLTRQHRTHMP